MTRLILLLPLALAACHSKASVPGDGSGTTPVPIGDLLAGLFGGDRTLVYDVTSESSFGDDQAPAGDGDRTSTFVVTCKQTVATAGKYRTATIDCDDADGAGRLLGDLERTFVTDGRRLWRLEGGVRPTTEADLDAALPATPDLVQGQQPVAGHYRDLADDDDGDGNPDDGPEDARFGSSHEVAADGDGWCIDDVSWGGDESGSGWCLSAARGVVSVSWYFDGGSSQAQRATLRAP